MTIGNSTPKNMFGIELLIPEGEEDLRKDSIVRNFALNPAVMRLIKEKVEPDIVEHYPTTQVMDGRTCNGSDIFQERHAVAIVGDGIALLHYPGAYKKPDYRPVLFGNGHKLALYLHELMIEGEENVMNYDFSGLKIYPVIPANKRSLLNTLLNMPIMNHETQDDVIKVSEDKAMCPVKNRLSSLSKNLGSIKSIYLIGREDGEHEARLQKYCSYGDDFRIEQYENGKYIDPIEHSSPTQPGIKEVIKKYGKRAMAGGDAIVIEVPAATCITHCAPRIILNKGYLI